MSRATRIALCVVFSLVMTCIGCGGNDGTPTETGDCEVTVRAPEEGDVFCTRKIIDLWWQRDFTSGRVDVDLYRQDAFVGRMRDNGPDLGSLDITCELFDATPGDGFSIRVADANDAGCFDDSDYFRIVHPDSCSIVVTDPEYSAHYRTIHNGVSHVIRWETENASNAVDIELVMEGEVVDVIANATPNDGEFLWLVEAQDCAANFYYLRISDSVAWNDQAACVGNSGPLKIDFVSPDAYECGVWITAPNQETTWYRRSDVTITFTASNIVGNEVRLDLFAASDSTLLVNIVNNLDVSSDLVLYPWEVETGEGNNSQNLPCFIRMVDEDSECCETYSQTFIITGLAR